MNHPDIIVFSREEFVHWRELLPGIATLRGAVSIGDPNSLPPLELDSLDCPVLRMEFLDLYDTGTCAGKRGPSSAHVLALSAFADVLRPRQGLALVHCDAGMSRGPSIGWLLYCMLNGPGREAQYLQAILSQRTGSSLNPWLIALAQRRFRQFDFATPAARYAFTSTRR